MSNILSGSLLDILKGGPDNTINTGYDMECSINENGGLLSIILTGSSDMAAIKDFSATVNTINDEKNCDIEIDMEGVEYLDSSFISLLLKLHKSQKQKDKNFKIVKASDRVTSLLNLCSLSGTLGQ